MDWKAHALVLQVRIQMNEIRSTELIDWGIELLARDIETPAVLRLARREVELIYFHPNRKQPALGAGC